MTAIQPRPSELAVPVGALRALRESLAAEVGDDAAARALRFAGSGAGAAMFRALTAAIGLPADDEGGARDALAALPEDRFWNAVSSFFAHRGWGRLRFTPTHQGVGALDTADWVEANTELGASRPSCFFTTGMLAGLLSRVAGEEIAMLEVACRSRGDAECRFLFGSVPALEAVYGGIAAGRSADASLAALG